MILLGGVLVVLFIGVQIYTLVSLVFAEAKTTERKGDLPFVSILLAARNEEVRLDRCLQAMAELDYPKDRLEILIGDDQSTDCTFQVAQNFIEQHPEFRLFRIEGNLGKGRGKANVLAHLAHRANGEFLFITDADVQVPKEWVKGILKAFDSETGIVSGTTMCTREGYLGTLQAVDWLHFMGYIKAFANTGMSCTAVGNNMAVRKEAYWQTGGFEELEFSITEDYRLFQAVTSMGWGWKTMLNRQTLGMALPIGSYVELLQQRKRWLIGARDLNWVWKGLLTLYASFSPVLLVLLYLNPRLALIAWAVKFCLQTAFITALSDAVGIRPFRLHHLVFYELFVVMNTFISVLFFILPFKTRWKGRLYRKQDLR